MKKIKASTTTKPSPTGSDSQDETSGDDVLFWINRSGFPISEHVWDRMYDHAAKIHPAGDSVVREIKNNKTHPPVSFMCVHILKQAMTPYISKWLLI